MKGLKVLLVIFTMVCSNMYAQLYPSDWGYALFDNELPDGSIVDSIDNDYTYASGTQYWLDGNCVNRSITVDKWNNNIVVMDVTLGAYDMGTFIYNQFIDGQEIHIRKNDTYGNELWTKAIQGPYAKLPSCITSDSNGDILVTGEFVSTVDFDPSMNVNSLTTQVTDPGDPNGFLLKLDANGDYVFSKLIGSEGTLDCTHVEADASGNYIVIGYYEDLADFDPGIGVANETASSIPGGGSYDNIFVLKLDSMGNYMWHYTVPVPDDDSFTSECTIDDNNNIYVVGRFKNTIDFSGSDQRTALAGVDGFLLKLDQNGIYQWDKVYRSPNGGSVGTVAFDGDDILITTQFKDSLLVDSSGVSLVYYSPGTFNSFIQKLNPAGQQIWGRTILVDPTLGSLGIGASDINDTKDFLILGRIGGTAIIELPNGNDTLTGGTFNGILDSTGTFVWAANRAGNVLPFETTFDHANNILNCGSFDGLMHLEEIASTNTLMAEGGCTDAFVYQLHGFCESQTNIVENTCGSYTSPSGNYTWTATGMYNDTLNSIFGCDSIITVDLTIINNLDNTVINSSPTLTANQTGASYQWLDCDNGNAIIPSATSQSYTATTSGNYAVEITFGSCVEISNCEYVSFIGLEENSSLFGLLIHPNPSNGIVTIDFDGVINSIQVVDMLGRRVNAQSNVADGTIDVSKLESGKYIVQISTNNSVLITQLVVAH